MGAAAALYRLLADVLDVLTADRDRHATRH
jgi:hypothetical protein